jgi:6-pyruvoyltetrahydropterin/6-carboxytetrahydropterin synthase
MYTIAVKRDFVAQHYLVGRDSGEENKTHSHHYQVELEVAGIELDQYGYLMNIVDIQSHLDAQVHRYRDRTLNDLPEFKGLNPSIECFAFILCSVLSDNIIASDKSIITVKIWENDNTWASYSKVEKGEAHVPDFDP